MKTKKGGKLFRKYMLNMLLLIFTGMMIMSLLVLAIETGRWSDEQTATLNMDTGIISKNVESIIYGFSGESGAAISESVPIDIVSNTVDTLCSADNCDIFICNTKGNVILCREMALTHQKNPCGNHSSYNIPDEILSSAAKGGYSEVTTLGSSLAISSLVVATPVTVNGKVLGAVFGVKPVVHTLVNYISQIAEIMLISGLITIAISTAIIYGMVYKITKPLKEMSYASKLYAGGDFSYKVSVKGGDELAELAQAFNKMASSLSVLESSRRSFVANVSHELKTPMTTIGGFIDGILDGTIPQEQEKKYLSIVSDEVKRLSRLVTGMLNMSKLEAGEMNINATEFDLSKSIFRTLLNFEKKINSKSIDITGLDTMQSVTVKADEDMLMQVIYNLVDNAIKFTPEGGYISVKSYSDGEKAYVSIRNSGSGISKEEIGKVFERFYKIDKSRSFDVKGAGLGLYIVENIVKLHNGEIKADSVEGQYTEFSFWIPVSQQF